MSEQLLSKQGGSSEIEQEGQIHVLDLVALLGQQKKLLILLPLITGILALVAAVLIKPTFSSTAVILPPQQQQSSGMAAMLGQLGGLAGAASGIAGLKNPNDLYIGMLQSRTIADNLIQQFELKKRFEVDTGDEARKKLEQVSKILSDKSSTIVIMVEDNDPKFAAELANAYVAELSKLTQNLAVTDASQRRLFFEKQLKKAKDDLADAEISLREIQENTGVLQLDGQIKGIISNVAQLEGEIAAKEVQLGSMRSFATNKNPDVIRLQQELSGMRAQLTKAKSGTIASDGDVMLPTSKLPKIGVDYVRSLRNVKYFETIFELLSKQYELAKIDEAKESSNIQILDRAVPAEKKIKPRRLLMVLGGLFGGGVLAIVLILLRNLYLKSRNNVENVYRWQMVSKAWGKKVR